MPPQHNVTAPTRFIPRTDPAWDLDKALAELDGLAGPDRDSHPMVKYFAAESRYDLDAPGVVIERDLEGAAVHVHRIPREYLKPDSKPVTWTLRRLKLTQQSQLADAPQHQAEVSAFALTVTNLENGPPGVEVKGTAGVPLSATLVDQLAEVFGTDMIYEVGRAAMAASAAPSSAEKKL
jgi:hypothetical protein